jgi:isopentenyl phosphate kinase
MRGKIAELIGLTGDDIESHIFHISRLGNFLDGIDHGGTIITKGETR